MRCLKMSLAVRKNPISRKKREKWAPDVQPGRCSFKKEFASERASGLSRSEAPADGCKYHQESQYVEVAHASSC